VGVFTLVKRQLEKGESKKKTPEQRLWKGNVSRETISRIRERVLICNQQAKKPGPPESMKHFGEGNRREKLYGETAAS